MQIISLLKSRLSRRSALKMFAVAPLVAASPSAMAETQTQTQTQLSEVMALLQLQKDAWNRGDIAGFCSLYAEDCIFLSPGGVTRGRAIVQERYTKKYGSAKETLGRLAFEVLDARTTPAMVTLAMRWSLVWSKGGSAKPPASGHTLIVWQKQAAGWRLTQDASM